MSGRTKYTAEEKYEILMEYENGASSIQELCINYSISAYAFYKWRYNYEKYGVDRLRESETYKKYSR